MFLTRAFVDLFGWLTLASFVTQWSWSSERLTVQLDVISNDYSKIGYMNGLAVFN